MGTSNFINHENGIYLIPEYTEEDAIEMLLENDSELTREEISDEDIYNELNFQNETLAKEFMEFMLPEWLKEKGFQIKNESNWSFTVNNSKGKRLAEIYAESGYYSGIQIIVETDINELFQDDSELYFDYRTNDYSENIVKARLDEVYSSNNKKLLKAIEKFTTPLVRLGGFSDGTSVYSYK